MTELQRLQKEYAWRARQLKGIEAFAKHLPYVMETKNRVAKGAITALREAAFQLYLINRAQYMKKLTALLKDKQRKS